MLHLGALIIPCNVSMGHGHVCVYEDISFRKGPQIS